jgi:sugar/nucleoside kinase (ribokinase family)
VADPRLVHVGNCVVDLVMYVPALPEPGGDVLAEHSGLTAGGALNTMVAARRQGLPVVYGGTHGTGPSGDLCRRQLAEADITVAHPVLSGVDTGVTVALVDHAGERTFATSVGAEARLTASHLAALEVRPGDVVCVSGYGLLHPCNGPALADWLPTLDPAVIVVVDPAPLVADIPARIRTAVWMRADWCSCNEREALAMTGAAGARAAAAAITARAGVVVRTGGRGCLLASPDGSVTAVPGFAVDVVDTNGAGDAHVGVFVAALAAGQTPPVAARRANAAAALAVTRRGPTTAPGRAETDDFLAAHGGERTDET